MVQITNAMKKALKDLIRQINDGTDPETIKNQFAELVKATIPDEIARVEQELIQEGMSHEEIHKLFDLHITIFRESLEEAEPLAPVGHPIYILLEEHKMLLKFAEDLRKLAKALKRSTGWDSDGTQQKQVTSLIEHFNGSSNHYLREENVIFPYLEKHGITGPPQIMWMEHDQIREIDKTLSTLLETQKGMPFSEFTSQLVEAAHAMAEMLSGHFFKENNILFTAALRFMNEEDWISARQQFDEIGYCCFTPEMDDIPVEKAPTATPTQAVEGVVSFETGSLPLKALEAILNTLPVDITFVNPDDTVGYYSQNPNERIFVRTKAVIGRTVQQCHPQFCHL